MFHIRDATLADMDVLRHIFRESALSNDGDRQVLLDNPDVLELSPTSVRDGRTRVATTVDGRIVGFATSVPVADTVAIEDLFVDPEWMRRGIGRTLVRDIVARAQQQGARRVEVTANQHALSFYRSAGFVFDREVDTRFGPAPRMRLDLKGGAAGDAGPSAVAGEGGGG